jgi:AraC-like DNA-binding protein
LVPETKEVYSKLINHYKIIHDSKNQLISVNKLLQIDSILDRNYKYINNKLEYDYDRPNLIKEKELLIRSLQNNNSDQSKTNWILISSLLISLMGFSLVYYKKIIYTKRFEYNLKNNNTNSENTIEKINTKSIVSEEVSVKVLSALKNFENKKTYLKPNLNLNKVAKTLNTNSKYLSILINQTYNKSVVQYINDLRIEYVILKLKEDQKFRKYTIKAIAIEIGFNTDQAFSKAFHKKTGVFPSSFIKELNT